MSKITSDLLAKIAPLTPSAKRDRFIPFMNEAMPRYGIKTEFQVASFLATACFESMYFKAVREGHARVGTRARRYQDKYWHTGYIGRGIFQVTHENGYRDFGIAMHEAGLISDPKLFLKKPELLEQPKWAVESACWYWKENNLNKYANKGLQGFFALQGRVNRGDPSKEALDYPDRLKILEIALRYMDDDFNLTGEPIKVPAKTDPSASDQDISETTTKSVGDITATENKTEDGTSTSLSDTSKNEQGVNVPAVVSSPEPYNGIGFIDTIKADLAKVTGGNLSFTGLSEYAQQASGWPPWVVNLITKLAVIVAILSIAWLLFRCFHYAVDTIKKSIKTRTEALINTDISRKDLVWGPPEEKKHTSGQWRFNPMKVLRKPSKSITVEETVDGTSNA